MKTIFLLFGATGDLAKRKLFPAFKSIFDKGDFDIEIFALGRREYKTKDFLETIKITNENFAKKISYHQIDITQKSDYQKLFDVISSQYSDAQIVLYLSVGPELFTPILSGVDIFKNAKIVFEKPFGTSLDTATKLNNLIGRNFGESQIYRIDHYIGKEAVQNILAFRFANSIFEPLWNNHHIDNIQITASETLGVEHRGPFYETSGALRDMLQNHLFQVLSLVIMDPPARLDAESISREKLKVFQSIRPVENFEENIVFGQYDGYQNEPGVDTNSKVETFVALKLEVENWRASGIPIYLKTGKALDKKSTQIVIEFKEIPNILFKKYGNIDKNRIILEIQPDESISIDFNVKQEENSKHVEKISSKFQKEISTDNAYQKLLEDIIIGDKTLFPTFEILKASWEIVDTLVECRENCPIVFPYKKGTSGPKQANILLEKDGRSWYNS